MTGCTCPDSALLGSAEAQLHPSEAGVVLAGGGDGGSTAILPRLPRGQSARGGDRDTAGEERYHPRDSPHATRGPSCSRMEIGSVEAINSITNSV